MQRRGDDSIRGRIARARARLRRGSRPVPKRRPTPKRRVPRREIQARRDRMVRWGVAAAGLLALIVLASGFIYDDILKPNQTLATVGSAMISRQDYWKSRAIGLYEQALQYQQFAQFVGPDQQGQYLFARQTIAGRAPLRMGQHRRRPGLARKNDRRPDLSPGYARSGDRDD